MKATRYKNVVITPAPRLPKFPDMVEITRTPKKLRSLMNKKYVNEKKAILAVDVCKADNLIESGRIKTNKELLELGMGDLVRW